MPPPVSPPRAVVLALWLALCAGAALIALRTPLLTDLTLFLPRADGGARVPLLAELREGPAARLLLIGIELAAGDPVSGKAALDDGAPGAAASDAEDQSGVRATNAAAARRAAATASREGHAVLAALSDALARRLRADPRFVDVANGRETGLDTLQQTLRPLFERRYLLLDVDAAADPFGVDALRRALAERLSELASPLGAYSKAWLANDPTGAFTTLLQRWQPPSRPPREFGVWIADGRALLLAETAAAGFDADAQSAAVAAVRRAFAAAVSATEVGRAAPRLLLGGAGTFAAASRAAIRADAGRLSVAATALVALLLWWRLRSLRLLALGALPLASGALAAIAAVGLLFGGLYGITLAFGITLLGIALDYPLHCFSHWLRHRRDGDDDDGSDDDGARSSTAERFAAVWPTLRLGALTTAIGFAAMLGADASGLQQLGVFAVVGLLSAAATTRWLLPALLPALAPRSQLRPAALPDALLHPPPWLAVASCGAALLAATPLALRPAGGAPLWQNDLAALSPVPAPALALDRELRRALGSADVGQLLAVSGPDAETVLRRSEALLPLLDGWRERGLIDAFDAAVRYLPSVERQRRRAAALPDAGALATALAEAQNDPGLPFRAGLFAPFLADVAATRAGRVEPLRPETLPAPLARRVAALLRQGRGRWLALLPLSGVSDPRPLAAEIERRAQAGVRYVSLRDEAAGVVAAFRERALTQLALGGALIVAVLLLALRSPRRALAVVLPVALAVAATAGLLALLGPLSLFHLVSLLLVLGVGLDYSLFFSRGDDPDGRRRTLHAVLLCAASTLAVFGLLALSELPVLRAMGQTVAIGVAASLLLSLTVAQQSR